MAEERCPTRQNDKPTEYPAPASAYEQLITQLKDNIYEIIRHGFGEIKIQVSIPKENKRMVLIQAAKSPQFTIAVAEIHK